eukprot:CAMPEP_0171316802 /NCGR_PEP_ID=MMETSP0816-20121228/75920_1 /TAXON_ID=420281 /ORGANISM="Proboscia inermis, Strain CCAP1064/1" /LENGTH=60 /DNA_ID=CAMNT_0011809309 /DNA_START=25 /DNA_END=203 /DNA_ORIENTATION=-
MRYCWANCRGVELVTSLGVLVTSLGAGVLELAGEFVELGSGRIQTHLLTLVGLASFMRMR